MYKCKTKSLLIILHSYELAQISYINTLHQLLWAVIPLYTKSCNGMKEILNLHPQARIMFKHGDLILKLCFHIWQLGHFKLDFQISFLKIREEMHENF